MAKVIGKNKDGSPKLKPWNHKEGDSVPYKAVSAGDDWWLSPAEPHCADCHLAPFVESKGGKYFPMDQKNKYSLFRYSKAHGDLACQTCHGSTHGLYPTKYKKDENNVDEHRTRLLYNIVQMVDMQDQLHVRRAIQLINTAYQLLLQVPNTLMTTGVQLPLCIL